MTSARSTDEWAFYRHQHRGWSWRRLVDARGSERHFCGIVEAIADAVANGFQPGISTIAAVSVCRRSQAR
jgi:hypothetical protein